MPFLFTYLFKLSVSLAVVFLVYHFVLRKLTFYNWNRWYLLGYTVLCFFIPFIDISPVLQKNELTSHTVLTWIPVIGEYQANETGATASFNFFAAWNIVSLVVIAGMLVMFLRLLFQLISFQRMMKKAKTIPGEGMNLYQVDEEIIPFSFGNSIFINQRLHTPQELQEIIRHEFVHVKQKHSIDIIWSELLCLINWYNPFAWLLKRSIRQNLEFIADSKVLENGINKKQYQYLLLKVIGNNQFSIAPKFNFSSLKKRIAMMNKLKTARLHLARFLFILPVLAVILVSFRQKKQDSIQPVEKKGNGFSFHDTIPGELNEKGYTIDVIGRRSNAVVVIKDKNGKVVERIAYSKWKENEESYEDKYGELPPPPPPPLPPTPPTPPVPMELPEYVKKIDVNNKVAKVWLKDGTIEKYDLNKPEEKAAFEKKYGKIPQPPTPPLPPAKELSEISLNKISDDFEITKSNATIKLKNGKVEKYDLTKPEQKAAFEKKYGEVIELPASSFSEEEALRMYKQAENRARVSNDFEITDTKAVLHLKNGVTEEYDLTNKEQRRKFGEKYGRGIGISSGQTYVMAPYIEQTSNSGKAVVTPMNPFNNELMIMNEYGELISGKEDILVTITKNTTPNQLEEFKKQMKEKGIELQFENTDYNDGILVSISGTMKSKDGHSNFAATDFNKLVLSRIGKGERTYFKVSVTDNKKVVI